MKHYANYVDFQNKEISSAITTAKPTYFYFQITGQILLNLKDL